MKMEIIKCSECGKEIMRVPEAEYLIIYELLCNAEVVHPGCLAELQTKAENESDADF